MNLLQLLKFIRWIVKVEALSEVVILLGNIIHLLKGTKMTLYVIFVVW